MSGISVEMVVHELGVTPRTLRYYEEVGLVIPMARNHGGHRLHNQSSIDRLKQIAAILTDAFPVFGLIGTVWASCSV